MKIIKLLLLFSICFNLAKAATNDELINTSIYIQKNLATQANLYLKTYCPARQSYCLLMAVQTGESFEKQYGDQAYVMIDKKLQMFFQKNGWQSNSFTKQYADNGPLSTIYMLQKNNLLILISFDVSGNTTHCPANQPTDLYQNCHLTPSERIYTVKIKLIQIK